MLFVILAVSTPFRVEHPVLFWTSAVIILAAVSMRLVLIRLRRDLARDTRYLSWLLAWNVCMTSGISGFVYVSALRFYGFESWSFAVTMQWIVGIAATSGC